MIFHDFLRKQKRSETMSKNKDKELDEELEREMKETKEKNRRIFNIILFKDLLIETIIDRNYTKLSKNNQTNFQSCEYCFFMDHCGSCSRIKYKKLNSEFEYLDIEDYGFKFLEAHLGLNCIHPRNPYPINGEIIKVESMKCRHCGREWYSIDSKSILFCNSCGWRADTPKSFSVNLKKDHIKLMESLGVKKNE